MQRKEPIGKFFKCEKSRIAKLMLGCYSARLAFLTDRGATGAVQLRDGARKSFKHVHLEQGSSVARVRRLAFTFRRRRAITGGELKCYFKNKNHRDPKKGLQCIEARRYRT